MADCPNGCGRMDGNTIAARCPGCGYSYDFSQEIGTAFLSLKDCRDAVGRRTVLFLANGGQVLGKMLEPDDRGRCRLESIPDEARPGQRDTFVLPREMVAFFAVGSLLDIVSPLKLK